ncbi:MAG: hypothetical protein BEN19_01685 [Epulopiscium sp. Nuni2H_MBin003]|nr:MAG: hypothetical protein BEN19_01685 [Epulopiscium sp. Nuni2H_MBin003]
MKKIIPFIVLYFIFPLIEVDNKLEIGIKSIKVLLFPHKVQHLRNGNYLTIVKGWDVLKHHLEQKGYKVDVMFYNITACTQNNLKIVLKGYKLNKYIIIWK